MATEQTQQQQEQEQQQQQQLSLSVCSDSIDIDADVDLETSINKTARLPRWTRQEILVLIQGKKVAENRVRRGRTSTLNSSIIEPKWATVSSYCKRHGVNRGAVQCRKRWSNLSGDFKKIKEWETRHHHNNNNTHDNNEDIDVESFWLMRNDLRRENKLPGFFDREVFDILDDNNKDVVVPRSCSPSLDNSRVLLFDSGRPADVADGLFDIPAPTPISISAKQYEPFTPNPEHTGEKQGGSNPEIGSTSQGERKRKRLVEEDEAEREIDGASASLLKVMEKNGKMLSAQLEAHNMNLKLDREDRKEHANSLVSVLNKLADALARIADKL